MIEGLAACFAGLADPRATRRCDHRLIDILVIAVCAVVACAESREETELFGGSRAARRKGYWARARAVCAAIACAESREDIELCGRSKQAWLKSFLALPNGIPSHDTFRRVFMLVDPDAVEACFVRWARSLTGKVEREVAAIDGKTVRRSGSRRPAHGPLRPVSRRA